MTVNYLSIATIIISQVTLNLMHITSNTIELVEKLTVDNIPLFLNE